AADPLHQGTLADFKEIFNRVRVRSRVSYSGIMIYAILAIGTRKTYFFKWVRWPNTRARAIEARFTDRQLWELLRSNPTTLGEAFFLARITEAHFEDQRSYSFNNKTTSNNSGLQNQNLTTSRFTMSRQEPIDEAIFVKVNDETKRFSLAESIEENNAFDATSSDQSAAGLEANKVVDDDQASELETKLLVDGKQDAVKVVGVADEQNNDEPNALEGNGVIGVGVNENNKGVDKEVKYSVYTLHVLIPFLKRLNDKYIKKKKNRGCNSKKIMGPEIKSAFQDNTLRARWF
nr:AIG1-like protein [Tanacetum cinerariifolium]